jgi:hypothetical protein
MLVRRFAPPRYLNDDDQLFILDTYPNRIEAEVMRFTLYVAGIDSVLETDGAGKFQICVRADDAAYAYSVLGTSIELERLWFDSGGLSSATERDLP